MKALLISVLMLFGVIGFAQNEPKAFLILEKDSLQLGEQTLLELEVIYFINKGEIPRWPSIGKEIGQGIEVLAQSSTDTTTVNPDEDPMLFKQSTVLTITCFDTGHKVIEPFWFRFGADSIRTNPLLLNVYAPVVDLMGDIKPLKPSLTIDYSVSDWLSNNWPWILLGLIVLICAYLAIRFLRKKPAVTEEAIVEIAEESPAHKIAFEKLEQLKSDGLWQKGMVKEYYVRLSDILREYMEGRYKILALEETTPEIIRELRGRHLDAAIISNAQKVLNLADMVKFAKSKPMATDNETCFQVCKAFIEQSIPKETIELQS